MTNTDYKYRIANSAGTVFWTDSYEATSGWIWFDDSRGTRVGMPYTSIRYIRSTK